MSEKITLVETPSGPIQLVHSQVGPVMQFNCKCIDALPFCKGMCCGMRHVYNTELTQKEIDAGKFSALELPNYPDKVFLAYDNADKKCVYQNKENGLCTIQEDKPERCTTWHCSPGGQGEGITVRDQGWIMLPIFAAKFGVKI